jgi:hypothetical protein
LFFYNRQQTEWKDKAAIIMRKRTTTKLNAALVFLAGRQLVLLNGAPTVWRDYVKDA